VGGTYEGEAEGCVFHGVVVFPRPIAPRVIARDLY
jgi:hypothetical protein